MRAPMLLLPLFLFLVPVEVGAHCEVPCGIYHDEMRVEMIREHAATIEKAMAKIVDTETNDNQRVRWIATKDDHAEQTQHIVWQYFMTQRIKPDAEAYAEKLALLHAMLRDAMKCKQTTDVAHVASLRANLDAFAELYFAGHEH